MTTTKMTLAIVAGVAVGIGIGLSLNRHVQGQPPSGAPSAKPKYTVVETQGVNLIVTDNSKNVTYFYTIEEGEEPGADLHLRGSVNLNQVGKPVIKPTLLRKKKEK